MPKTIRTFIAIELNDQIHSELADLQSSLKKSAADVKWVDPSSIHLTLKFIGNIEEDKIKDVEIILSEAAKTLKPFSLTFKEIGAFPDLDFPRIIWVGLESGASETGRIAKLLEEKLTKIGIPKEDRRFLPHITLGRVKSEKNKDKLKEMVKSAHFEPKAAVMVEHLTLFESRLTQKGPIYTPLFKAKI